MGNSHLALLILEIMLEAVLGLLFFPVISAWSCRAANRWTKGWGCAIILSTENRWTGLHTPEAIPCPSIWI